VLRAEWPKSDPELAKEDELEFAVQVNGKLVSVVKVPRMRTARRWKPRRGRTRGAGAHRGQDGGEAIVVPGKLVNLVVK